jgi:hypothetical protein
MQFQVQREIHFLLLNFKYDQILIHQNRFQKYRWLYH